MTRKFAYWSPDDLRRLKALHDAGRTQAAIARALHRPRSGVHYYLRLLGRTKRYRYLHQCRGRLLALCAAGASTAAVARELGACRKAVRRWRRQEAV